MPGGTGHSDNRLDIYPVTLDGSSAYGATSLSDPSDPVRSSLQSTLRDMKRLPAAEGNQSNINFLGSSYSGADVKVVAHLYDVEETGDRRKEELEFNKTVALGVRDGATALLSGGFNTLFALGVNETSYYLRKQNFVFATGISPSSLENQKAIRILTVNLFNKGDWSFLGIARANRSANTLQQMYVNLVNEYVDQLDALSKADTESSSTVVLGTLQTMSVQSFREKHAVRALGHAYAKGYTRGTRTIGGSCIFTVFNEHALSRLIRSMGTSAAFRSGEKDSELSTLLADQLPPIDLTIAFANEYGALSEFRLYGVEFVSDGIVLSIEDLLTEESMNFVARDYDPMTSRGQIEISRLQRGMHNTNDDKDKSASSLMFVSTFCLAPPTKKGPNTFPSRSTISSMKPVDRLI